MKNKNYTKLQTSVENSLHEYFSTLEDATTNDLYNLVIKQVELPLLKEVLNYCKGNHSMAARILGLARNTLRKKLKEFDLD